MLQNILVFIIVALAVFFTARMFYRAFSSNKKCSCSCDCSSSDSKYSCNAFNEVFLNESCDKNPLS